MFPAHWFLMTGYYLSCQPAARVIIDGANPSLSAQLFTYYGPGEDDILLLGDNIF